LILKQSGQRTNLHYRGARIWEAVLEDLLAKGMNRAENVCVLLMSIMPYMMKLWQPLISFLKDMAGSNVGVLCWWINFHTAL
jgi:hypothetical protein